MLDFTDRPVIIGGGALGGAVALGFVRAGGSPLVSHAKSDRVQEFQAAGIRTFTDNKEAVAATEGPVLIAVKPWLVEAVVKELAPLLKGRVCCSMAAKVTLEQLKHWAPEALWGRAIPNIAAAVGAGFAGMSSLDWDVAVKEAMIDLFKTEGGVAWVNESELNMVSAISGSAIAYLFMIQEAFIQGGLSLGLPALQAIDAALSTFEGAARLARETGRHPAALKDSVCTPGGTTIAGLRVLEQRGLKSAIIDALDATCQAGVPKK